MTTVEERFWSKADTSGDGCWPWTSAKFRKGYGAFQLDGRNQGAHRVSWALTHGPIPEGMQLDHTCHTEAVERGECSGGDTCPHRACVNPAHLEIVTRETNRLRGLSPSTIHGAKTHCAEGHPYSGSNLKIGKRGDGSTFRVCRECHRVASMRYVVKKRAERAGVAKPTSGV